MIRYKQLVTAGVALTTIVALTGCGSSGNDNGTGATPTNNAVVSANTTNENNSVAVSQNETGTSNDVSQTTGAGHSSSNQIQGDVLTLSVKPSTRASLPSIQQTATNSELHSTYGTIDASSSKKTVSPLEITLTSHRSKDVIYADDSKSLKWLMDWQLSGNYLYLNVGEPTPNMTTTDFGGEAVVVNLETRKISLKQPIGMESQVDEFITPTSLVSLGTSLTGVGNSIVDFYTSITSLETGSSVTLNSTSSYPLGHEPYALGNRVYFASGSKIYFVDVPVAAWSGGSHKPYQLVLKPSVKIS